jgi:hypothetical protein
VPGAGSFPRHTQVKYRAIGGVRARPAPGDFRPGAAPRRTSDHMWEMTAVPNSEHFTSVAPSISRAKS